MPYATSSGGVFGLSKALAPRLAEDGIRVNLLMPGNVDTPLKRRAEEAMNASGRARNPVLAEPAGVARVVRFPLSDEADYVRGEVFTRGRRRRESLGRSGESRGCPFGILSTGVADLFVSAWPCFLLVLLYVVTTTLAPGFEGQPIRRPVVQVLYALN